MPSERVHRLVDFLLWVATASAAVVVASLALGLVVGADLLTGKYVLFVVGFLLFGVASLLMQPSKPGSDESSETGAEGASPSSSPGGISHSGEFGRLGAWSPDVGDLQEQLGVQEHCESRFEARLQAVAFLADADLPIQRRIGREYKLFVTSLVVLGVSFGMELLGVHV